MAEDGGAMLTEQEAAVYDRQIRVWGVEAQKKMSKSNVLVGGQITGVIAEALKNIVLAGVGSLTIIDDTPVSAESASAIFLLTPDLIDSGVSVGQACANALKEFNPMVAVRSLEGNIREKAADFYDAFNVVLIGRAPLDLRKRVNNLCRSRPHRISFFFSDVRGGVGQIFVDLQEHTHIPPPVNNEPQEPQTDTFVPFEEATSVPWKSLPKRTDNSYFALSILEQFEEKERRKPGSISRDDLPALLTTRDDIAKAQGIAPSKIPENVLSSLADAGPRELPAVSAIVGGILGQEILKSVSGKGRPVYNHFFYSVVSQTGNIELVARTSPDDQSELRP